MNTSNMLQPKDLLMPDIPLIAHITISLIMIAIIITYLIFIIIGKRKNDDDFYVAGVGFLITTGLITIPMLVMTTYNIYHILT